mgnify:CR=1 FL=1
MSDTDYDVIIMGGGPAGLSAGLYLARDRFKTVIIDKQFGGGQLSLTHAIANYPGVEEIGGFDLAELMKKQVQEFGCELMLNTEITGLGLTDKIKTVEIGDKKLTAKAIIICVGGSPRKLGLESEEILKGRGISYCATCDGPFFRDKDVIVVGGGNSALEESVYLTKFAKSVKILVRGEELVAHKIAIQEAEENEKIELIYNVEVKEFIGENRLEKVRIYNSAKDSEEEIEAQGAFIFIGYVPNTKSLEGIINIDNWGGIITDQEMATNVPGVYAAGDARAKKFRQVVNAAGEGCVAALASEEYIGKEFK